MHAISAPLESVKMPTPLYWPEGAKSGTADAGMVRVPVQIRKQHENKTVNDG